MPTSARKSSIGGARRGIQKAHIPYRGDNPAVGKKTGITVRHVERRSDGFEPFEDLLQQMDKRTPPPLAKVRRRKKSAPVEEEHDEYGEMSMELDNSPMPHYSSARQLATPSRSFPSSHIVAQTPETDFNDIPSPRPRSLGRKSMAHAGAGPSRLSRTSFARQLSPEVDLIDDVSYKGSRTNGFDQRQYSPDPQSPQQTSFTLMNQDDDDDEENESLREPDVPFISDPPELSPEVEEEPVRKPSKTNTGKEKVREEENGQRDSVEEERPSFGHDYGMEEEEPVRETKSKKSKGKEKATAEELNGTSERPRKRAKKENKPLREGVRKSAREHIKPLEWWRGERYVYGRDQSAGPVMVAPIKEIMRIPKEPPVPLGAKRRRSHRGRSRSRFIEQPPVLYNPEEGWDDDTVDKCKVLEYPGGAEKMRRIGFTAKMYNPVPAANNGWRYERIFGDSEFIAAGQMSIPVAGRKPSKSAKDNTYIFYVAEGAVNFKVHDTSLILATGGMVMVPRGNTYYIENIADREAKLVFTQARKMPPSEEEAQFQRLVNNRRSIETGI